MSGTQQRSGRRFWFVAGLILAVNVAGWLGVRHELRQRHASTVAPVRLVAALPREHVDRTDRLSLVFDGPLAAPDAVGKPLEQAPFRTVPEVAGEWVWSKVDRLDLMLEKPLPAGRKIQVVPAINLELQTGKAIQVSEEIEYVTRALQLESCQVLSADREVVNVELKFNQAVEPKALLRALNCTTAAPVNPAAPAVEGLPSATPDTDAAEPLVATTLVQEPSDRHVVRIARPTSAEVTLKFTKGLSGVGATLGLEEDVIRTLQVPPLAFPATATTAAARTLAMVSARAATPGFDGVSEVTLGFSLGLKAEQPQPVVTVTPPVEQLSTRFTSDDYGDTMLLGLEGAFVPGTRYTIAVAPTLRAADGTLLAEDSKIDVEIPDRRPDVAFALTDGILSPQGNLQLELRSIGIEAVSLSSHRVHVNNLVPHLLGEYTWRTARLIAEKRVPLLDGKNQTSRRMVDLKPLIDKPTGIYRIRAAATDHTWTSDEATVTVTNLGMTVKHERQAWLVWVTSLRTAQPVVGARVSALSRTNQTLATAVTDADGLVRLPIDKDHPDGAPWVIAAEAGEDLAYWQEGEGKWVLDDVDQSGRNAPENYDVWMYTERGVYRPGDTLHVTGVIRDPRGATPAPFPLTVNITRPDGRRVAQQTVVPEAGLDGVFQFDFPTRDDAQTGPYRFTATLPGGGAQGEDQSSFAILGSTQALVEAFIPVRLEVKAEPGQKLFQPGETAAINVSARYLFGQPAAGLTTVLNGSIQPIRFEPVSADDRSFTFGTAPQGRREIRPLEEVLDDQGHAQLTLPETLLGAGAVKGVYRGLFSATVTEPGGRSVSKFCSLNLDTAGRHVGLRTPAAILPVNAQFLLDWIVRDGVGAAVPAGEMECVLQRVEYDSVMRRSHGSYHWTTTERLTPVWNGIVNENAEISESAGQVPLTCPVAGDYRLTVTDRLSGSVTQLEFHAATEAGQHVAVSLRQPDRIELVADREIYTPGNAARILVNSPFAGTLLLCLETDRVLTHQLIEMRDNSQVVEVTIPREVRGGAFVTATVLRPLDPRRQTWLPHRAMGLLRLKTDHVAATLPIALDVPAKARPGDHVKVSVEVDPTLIAPDVAHAAAEPLAGRSGSSVPLIHVWAVDEGILLTTNYRTPDPRRHFLGLRKPGVSTADRYGDLLPDFERPASLARIGGDGSGEVDSLRRNPVATPRSTPAVVWHTIQPAPNGRLSLDLTLPEFTGELRFMAVAICGDQYGSAQQSTTMSQPVMVEASWPRVLAPGDASEIPVKLFNATPQPVMVTLDVNVSGPLEATLPLEQQVLTVNPQAPVTVWMPVKATGIGAATYEIVATSSTPDEARLVSLHKGAIPVRSGTPLMAITQTQTVEVGKPLDVAWPDGLLPGMGRMDLSLSARPNIQLQTAVQQLVDYPYGCVEQTSSRIYALLAARDLLTLQPGTAQDAAAAAMIDAGIARLWSMQTRSGGLSYWPGGIDADTWGTGYAAGALLVAQQHGHVVDLRFTQELAAYLRSVLHGQNRVSDNEKAHLCRVLAGFQQPDMGWMARLSERLSYLDMGGRADLATAWLLSGRKDRALEVLPAETIHLAGNASYSGRLTSTIHRQAQLLAVLLELDPEHAWIAQLVQQLDAARQQRNTLSTFENAALLSALSQYQAQHTEPAEFKGLLEVGAVKQSHPFDHKQTLSLRVAATDSVHLTSEGMGKFFLTSTATGVAKEPVPEADQQLEVRRAWLNRDGQPIDTQTLHVGDLITVVVTIKSRGDSVPNVAIVDTLPGGLEIENPRLATSAAEPNNGGDRSENSGPDHVQFLDDRVVLFCAAHGTQQTFSYPLRVVSIGSFTLPPVQASCMYNETLSSVHGAGTVRVVRP